MSFFDIDMARAIILFATPLLLAALGELVVERAGVVNIGIEGLMLTGALAAWCGNVLLSPIAGLGAAMLASVIVGMLFALVVLVFAADQIVAGTGINLLALGLTGIVYRIPRLHDLQAQRINPMWLAVVVLPLAVAIWIFLRRTRAGLELTAIGEAPEAADTAGVPVGRRKMYAIAFGAACAGLAGAYLSTMRVGQFQENMTDGLGFLALAIVIFGRWKPPGVILAALFFGLVRACAERLALRPGFSGGTHSLLDLMPYVVSLIALAGAGWRSGSPTALGRAYVRE